MRRDLRNEESWEREGWNRIIVWECALAPKMRERTLERICSKVAAWSEECASGKSRRIPHRLELPYSRRFGKLRMHQIQKIFSEN